MLNSSRNIQLLFRQISVLLRSGLSIDEAIKELDDFPAKNIQDKLKAVSKACAHGEQLSKAQALCPELTHDLPEGILSKGISYEGLAEVYQYTANNLEKSREIRLRLIKAAIYPAFVMFFALQVLGVLIVFVVPQFESMFSDFGSRLPAPTIALIEFSKTFDVFIASLIFLILLIVVLRFVLPKAFFRLISLIPLARTVLKRSSIFMFSKKLSLFIRCGVPPTEALKMTISTLKYLPVTSRIREVDEGENITKALRSSNYFPKMFLHVVGVGERSDTLADALHEFSIYYEKDVDVAFHRMILVTEVVTFITVAIAVGWGVLAMYLPIFKLAGTVGG